MGLKTIIFICLLLYLISFTGCGGMPGFEPSPQPSKTHSSDSKIFEAPVRLIKNFGIMKEDETVSWSWIDPGFRLSNVSSMDFEPLQNFSGIDFPFAEESISKGLKNIFTHSANENTGFLNTSLKAAIVDMKPRKGFAGRYVPFIDDTTYIEVEIIIYDKNAQTPLCQIIHYSSEDTFQRSLDLLLQDVAVFAKKTIGG